MEFLKKLKIKVSFNCDSEKNIAIFSELRGRFIFFLQVEDEFHQTNAINNYKHIRKHFEIS